ncbi:MAG TPA: aminomethyl-transferring glycine dehydrogenase subunit GcvPA [Lacipirellulaceae bacterium]|nr:aminomethyl-transferring glycine dehydrogenase subunit GcvPA [Lacipirellulaceae bacterium]
MPYLYNTSDDQREMLTAIGASSVDELFDVIPDDLKLNRPLCLPPAMSELELDQHLRQLAAANQHAGQLACFLGGGSYDHFVPAVCDVVGSRSEFYTSYTPYQAEASQGNLQVMFEYQSLIARLTGLDVANSSLYDGASAAAEAVLMALHAGGRRNRVVVPANLHPEYRQAIATYLENLDAEVVTLPCPAGVIDADALAAAVDDQTAAVLLQQPNFFGCVEDADRVVDVAKAAGALVIAVFDPVSLGLLKRPGDYGSDGRGANIAVAEGHTLGTSMSYGGPYLGIMACEQALVRRMPGRIVGETKDRRGKRCFVLTLQTREQHIRRDKATSNVCTNQALFAVRASVYLAQLGPQGLRETANLCLQKSRYLAEQLCQHERFSLAFEAPTFKEFVVRDAENDVDGLLKTALEAGYLAGLPLGRWYPELADCLLIAVTERRTRGEVDGVARTLMNCASGQPVLAK